VLPAHAVTAAVARLLQHATGRRSVTGRCH
jgi:hypothetical protein